MEEGTAEVAGANKGKALAAREVLRLASRMVDETGVDELRHLVLEETKSISNGGGANALPDDIEHLVTALHALLGSSDATESERDRQEHPHRPASFRPLVKDSSFCSSPVKCMPSSAFVTPQRRINGGDGGLLNNKSASPLVGGGQGVNGETEVIGLVLNNPSLLQEIFNWVIGVLPKARDRWQLNRLSLVNKLWKDIATADLYWKPISQELFPVLPLHPSMASAATTTTGGGERAGGVPSVAGGGEDDDRTECRRSIMGFGKALGEPRYRTTSAWQEGLTMVYEVTDQNDGRRLFYGTGPIHVAVGQNVILRLTGPARHEVSETFSAADRDPELQRFPTVRDFFKACHGSQYPASLRVRVVVCDHSTGKMALLYQSGKTFKRHAKVPNASYWQDFLPDDSYYIWDTDSVLFGGEGQVKLAAAFYVVASEDDQEDDDDGGDVDDKDRRYRIAGGDAARYNLHSSYVSLDFSTTDGEAVGRFIKSLLA